ncbi:hexose transporter [Truncatella angustata]|uniref:Hexose transporter n=1 Tax=Truncatella angustata TaxID=152316 RepID=A0A9P9A3A3_9PEZI|nr:hexose transporter [Truncatella angustata]KAH6660257.1 hexose transporter [Truncatella angustata]
MASYIETFGEFSSTMHGVIVSSILIPGALAALVAGILADRYGRTRMIAIGSTIFGVGAALETASSHLVMFIIGRLVKGAGEGIFLSTVYVHVCEISPAKKRGIISALPQLLITIGLVMGFFISYGTAGLDGSISWRLPIAVQAFFAFTNAALCGLVPPSPRWLQAKGRPEEARTVIAQLGLDEAEQAELLAVSESGLEHSPDSTFWENIKQTIYEFREAFSKPFRSRTIFGYFLMAMQQFSGIDGVLYYAPLLLQQAGISSSQASFLASGVSALLIMAVTIPAALFADSWGRKTSTVLGGTLIFVLMLLMGSMYAAGEVHADSGAGRWVVIVSIYLFAVVFNMTWAIGIRSFLIESLPRKTRSSAASLGQGSNWLANYVVALTTPVFISSSSFGAYYFFAFCSLFTTIMCIIFMYETKGHSLEVIEQRYTERQSSSTGRWRVNTEGFRMRRIGGTQD